jgi:hypothetical protein
MSYAAKILADSVAPYGARLTTFEITFPRIVLAEFNTHRMLSRNAASSRAIPIAKMIERVEQDPFIPKFHRNQKGMQPAEPLAPGYLEGATQRWLMARTQAVHSCHLLSNDFDVHKQWANRLLEPWMWTTVIASATDWENFFHLRCDPNAQAELREIACMMRSLYRTNQPEPVRHGEWHLPLVFGDDFSEAYDEHGDLNEQAWNDLKRVSAGRCARVSHLTHDGIRDPRQDRDLCGRLIGAGHWSPLEHQATPIDDRHDPQPRCGNLRGWQQFRKEFLTENVLEAPQEAFA